MKQLNKLYREGNYGQSELVARKGLDVDPENLALQAAILVSSRATDPRTAQQFGVHG